MNMDTHICIQRVLQLVHCVYMYPFDEYISSSATTFSSTETFAESPSLPPHLSSFSKGHHHISFSQSVSPSPSFLLFHLCRFFFGEGGRKISSESKAPPTNPRASLKKVLSTEFVGILTHYYYALFYPTTVGP